MKITLQICDAEGDRIQYGLALAIQRYRQDPTFALRKVQIKRYLRLMKKITRQRKQQ